MANYPTLTLIEGSVKEADTGLVVTRAVAGTPVFRNYFTATRNIFKIQHECTNANKLAVENHYLADRMNGFLFYFYPDNTNYTVRYADYPKFTPIEGVGRWLVEVTLIEQ